MTNAKNKTIALAASLDTAAAPELADQLRVVSGQDVELDSSGVKSAGAQCVQVLLAAAAAWKAEGRTFSIVSPSADFEEALRLLGLSLDKLTAGGASA